MLTTGLGGAGGIENPGFCRRRAELRDCACHEEPAYERSVGTRKRLSVRPEPSGVGEGVVRERRFFLRRNARRGVGRVGHFEDFLVTPPVAHVPRDIKFGPSPHFLNLGALQTRPPSARAAPNKPVLGAVSEARRFGTASAGSGYRTIRRPGPSRHPSKNLAPLN